MAKRLKSFEFGRVDQVRYPWDDWLDGSPWELHQGEDFAIPVHNMRATCVGAATRRGMKVRTSLRDKVLVIQAYKPSTNGTAK